MADIFISYSHDDHAFVRRMVPALEAEGFSVWWDHTIPPGQSWDSFIARGIKEAKTAIVVWSETSVASEWVKEEASIARGGGKYLPVQIDSADPPIGFSRIQAAQLFGWDGNTSDPQWKMLVGEVRRIMAEGGAVTPSPRRSTARSSASNEPERKKGPPVAALLVALVLIGAASAAGYFYLNQSGPGSEAKTESAAPAESTELAELRRQMAETQAALAEERRLREEKATAIPRPMDRASVSAPSAEPSGEQIEQAVKSTGFEGRWYFVTDGVNPIEACATGQPFRVQGRRLFGSAKGARGQVSGVTDYAILRVENQTLFFTWGGDLDGTIRVNDGRMTINFVGNVDELARCPR